MAFKLKKRETAADGIRRIAREEIDTALKLTKDRRSRPETVVHELRKQVKKLRSIVRLVEDELGKRVADRDNSIAGSTVIARASRPEPVPAAA